jgi:DNA repair photolyase
VNPPSRFERIHIEEELEQIQDDDRFEPRTVSTEFFPDESKTVITENDSPDVPFRFSVNPYRGCEHGCAYCYARPYHEMLGMNAGLDFETKILVKFDAARLLRRELCDPSWEGEAIAMSGVTDCYQPCERKLRITRGLLEVMLEAGQATAITTKNSLVLRDLDLLTPMATIQLVHVNISIATLDADLSRRLEPRTATPQARLRAVGQLNESGIPVRVLVAPIIPGLTDHQVPSVMKAAKEAGAIEASYELLRLPHSVAPVFLNWLDENYPHTRTKTESLIRVTREGRLNDSEFGQRMIGSGAYAESICSTVVAFAGKYGLDRPLPPLNTSRFQPPRSENGQMRLF